MSCHRFSFDTIQKATNYFDDSLVVGRGGFGKVYKGVVENGSTTAIVAVKRLNPESKQGVIEFETEIKMLSKFSHCHLVTLVGFCDEPPEMILVYEYMAHETLADHLYKKDKSLLIWEQRLKICIGAARGLDYLHTGTGLVDRVIHLDVKSSNILLDENWAAKIADLGLSRTGPADQPYSDCWDMKPDVQVLLFRACWAEGKDHVRGTRGFIDPEYRKYRKFSRKADIYAFGVVLLEVLTGARVLGGDIIPNPDVTDLANWTQRHVKNETLKQIIDPSLLGQIEGNCLEIFAETARKCLQNDGKKRPTMTEVVVKLESALAFQKNTNPSTSIVEDDIFRHFNEVRSESGIETTVERERENEEESSNHNDAPAEHEPVDYSTITWSTLRITKQDYSGRNLFGEAITNETLKQMGLEPTRENRAQVAHTLMDHGGKYDEVLCFVKSQNKQFGKSITTLCLVYNATGETLIWCCNYNWHGNYGSMIFPVIILNGQWGAFIHKKTPKMPSGSVAALVYRCKYSNNTYCDRMIAWSIPWQRFTQINTAYCGINETGYFHGKWDAIHTKLSLAGAESSAHWKDCYTSVSVQSDKTPIYRAILSRIDV